MILELWHFCSASLYNFKRKMAPFLVPWTEDDAFFSGFIAWSQWLPRKTDNQYWDSEITSKCKDCRPLCLNWQDWNWQFSNKPPFVLRLLGTPVEVILIILGFTLGKATEQIGRSKILYGRLEFLLITYNVNFVEIYLSSILWFWMAKDYFIFLYKILNFLG